MLQVDKNNDKLRFKNTQQCSKIFLKARCEFLKIIIIVIIIFESFSKLHKIYHFFS